MDNQIKTIDKKIFAYSFLFMFAVLLIIGLIKPIFIWYSVVPAIPGATLLLCKKRPYIKAFSAILLSLGILTFHLSGSYVFLTITTIAYVLTVFYLIITKSK